MEIRKSFQVSLPLFLNNIHTQTHLHQNVYKIKQSIQGKRGRSINNLPQPAKSNEVAFFYETFLNWQWPAKGDCTTQPRYKGAHEKHWHIKIELMYFFLDLLTKYEDRLISSLTLLFPLEILFSITPKRQPFRTANDTLTHFCGDLSCVNHTELVAS